jgi:prepilin-type N-terminal cleavage/methylation domain-containing protein
MPRRPGYTLLELLCVVAVLAILGAVILPTLGGLFRDTRTQAAGDMVRGWASEARARAIEDGRSYQLLVSIDGRRLRVGPDELEQAEQPAETGAPLPLSREDALPDTVTLMPMMIGESVAVAPAGWVVVCTFKPDGTCREASAQFQLQEPGVNPLTVSVRGLTGGVVVSPSTQPAVGGVQP